MLKKKLALIASFGTLTMVMPEVVACGISLEQLAIRSVNDPTHLRSFFTYPPTSWSSGVTNKVEDNKILADLVGTLVATDKYNRSFGDLAQQDDKSSRNVGQPNQDASVWKYKIAPNAKWFDYTGKYQRNIKASDMINAAKYVLFPKNLSETFSIWISFIAGAQEIWDYFQNDYQPTTNVPYFHDQIWDKLGMTVNDQDNEVTIKLVKSAPYFDTLMTYLAFAPMPEIALIKGYNYGTNYRNIWYSGAYLVAEYNSSSRILLKKNHQYRFANLTYINYLEYTYLANVDVSRPRLLFESGDITGFAVSPTDISGWNKYVGKDPAHPVFSGASSTINPDPSTFILMYNYSNTDIINGKNATIQNQALKAAKALQYQKIRKFLALNLDRSKFVRYYSEPLDTTATSSFLRNVYTTRNFVYNKGHDYVSYIEDEYAKTFLNNDTAKARALLKDGSDAFYHNQDLLQGDQNLIAQIRDWLQTNLGQSAITLRILLSGSNNLTVNKKVLDMIDSFNNNNNIIKIVPDITVDNNDYIKRYRTLDWDLSISGWSPDFADPFTYLNTFALKGDYQSNTGTNRVFGDLEFNHNGLAPDYQDLHLNNSYWNKLKDNPEMVNFYTMFQKYTNQVKTSDTITAEAKIEQRYQGFAQAEFKALYQDFMFLPLYVPNGSYQITVSYVVPKTTVTVGYGSSKYKHWGVKMSKYLLKQKQRDEIEATYANELAIIKNNYDAFRDQY